MPSPTPRRHRAPARFRVSLPRSKSDLHRVSTKHNQRGPSVEVGLSTLNMRRISSTVEEKAKWVFEKLKGIVTCRPGSVATYN